MTSLTTIRSIIEAKSLTSEQKIQKVVEWVQSIVFPQIDWVSVINDLGDLNIICHGTLSVEWVEELGRGIECGLRGRFHLTTKPLPFPHDNMKPYLDKIKPYIDKRIIAPTVRKGLREIPYKNIPISSFWDVFPFVYDVGDVKYRLSLDDPPPGMNSNFITGAWLIYDAEVHADYPRITNR